MKIVSIVLLLFINSIPLKSSILSRADSTFLLRSSLAWVKIFGAMVFHLDLALLLAHSHLVSAQVHPLTERCIKMASIKYNF